MKTKINQEVNITSLENHIVVLFFAIKAVVISPGGDMMEAASQSVERTSA